MALPSPEEVLLYRIQQQNEGLASPEAVGTMGAAAGAVAGVAAGSIPHQLGRGLNAITGRHPNPIKPGARMAGGFIGAVMGGLLGDQYRRYAISQSPEAQILAQMQMQGGVTDQQQKQLQQLMAQTYSQIGV